MRQKRKREFTCEREKEGEKDERKIICVHFVGIRYCVTLEGSHVLSEKHFVSTGQSRDKKALK